jgi:creatinine amidohydrolase/Fe(II)-dependent formamide hydrolase-like protein
VEFVDDVPKNDRGKVDRKALRRARSEARRSAPVSRAPASARWRSSRRTRSRAVSRPPTAVLLPVGSVEPHGPHLPLGTDTLISEEAAERAAALLARAGVAAYVAPSVPYGVTDFAAGLRGRDRRPAAALTAFLAAIARASSPTAGRTSAS